jgi:hypothetical protein
MRISNGGEKSFPRSILVTAGLVALVALGSPLAYVTVSGQEPVYVDLDHIKVLNADGTLRPIYHPEMNIIPHTQIQVSFTDAGQGDGVLSIKQSWLRPHVGHFAVSQSYEVTHRAQGKWVDVAFSAGQIVDVVIERFKLQQGFDAWTQGDPGRFALSNRPMKLTVDELSPDFP